MAIYHLTAKVISRARGQSIVAAAGYRFGISLRDERYGTTHRFARKRAVEHAEILVPADAPAWAREREVLWNRVEAGERRRDAQLAREIEVGLPVELSHEENVALVRDYVLREFVSQGMIADVCISRSESNNPLAHILLTLRTTLPLGFGRKARHWNRKSNLLDWRAAWAEHANLHLARAGHPVRIDHRTLEAQQSELAPARRVGIGAARQSESLLPNHLKDRIADQQRIAHENGETLLGDPTVALRELTRQRPTFKERDLTRFLQSRTHGAAQFEAAFASIMKSDELVALREGAGEAEFTSQDMIEAAKSVSRRAVAMSSRRGAARVRSMPAHDPSRLLALNQNQRSALDYLTGEGDIRILVAAEPDSRGDVLRAARSYWHSQDLRVIGAAITRGAVEKLEAAGIESQLLTTLEQTWVAQSAAVNSQDVIVVDEAETLALKQLERVLAAADNARAKLVLLADPTRLEALGRMSPLTDLAAITGRQPA